MNKFFLVLFFFFLIGCDGSNHYPERWEEDSIVDPILEFFSLGQEDDDGNNNDNDED